MIKFITFFLLIFNISHAAEFLGDFKQGSFILGKTYLQFLIAVLFAPDNAPKVLNKKEVNLADMFNGKILNKKNIKKTIIY